MTRKHFPISMALAICVLLFAGCFTTMTLGYPRGKISMFELEGMPLYAPHLQSRAITMENPTGLTGQGGQAHGGRKGAAMLPNLAKNDAFVFAEIDEPGCIRHIWLTVEKREPHILRNLILRFYWDGQETPSVEAPLSDFFGVAHGRTVAYESAYLTTPDGRGFNCFFPMPFAHKARLVVTNESDEDAGMFFYQVDYTIGDTVDKDTPYFHAQFRRVPNTTMGRDYVILDGVRGKGRFMGANLGIIDRFAGMGVWWGEGEVKMYIDGDTDFPTICGTGAEDYIGAAWGLESWHGRYFGAPLVNGKFNSIYRFHGLDPVYFSKEIRVTIQQLGNDGKIKSPEPHEPLAPFHERGEYRKDRPEGLFERVDDVCSTAYWYQTLPTQPFPPFPSKEVRSMCLEE